MSLLCWNSDRRLKRQKKQLRSLKGRKHGFNPCITCFRVHRTRRRRTLSPTKSAGSESSAGKESSERSGRTGLWFWEEISCSSVRKRWVTGGQGLKWLKPSSLSADWLTDWLITGAIATDICLQLWLCLLVKSFSYCHGNDVMLHTRWDRQVCSSLTSLTLLIRLKKTFKGTVQL